MDITIFTEQPTFTLLLVAANDNTFVQQPPFFLIEEELVLDFSNL